MHLVVDHSRQEVASAGVDDFGTVWCTYLRIDSRDAISFDQNVGIANDAFIHQPCVGHE